MTKVIALILSLLMSASVTPVFAIDADAVEKGYTAYNELTTAISVEMQQGWEKSPEEYGVSDIFAYNSMSTFGYMWLDLDNDGVDELLLGEASIEGSDTPIYDLFRIDETGELVHVLTGWERNRWYLIDNGILLNEGSNSADDSISAFYEYKNGELSELNDEAVPADPEPLMLDFTLFVDTPVIGPGGINPWTEASAEELVQTTGISFDLPEGAENIVYSYMYDGNEPLAQAVFTYEGLTYCARMKSAVEFEDISGLYYNWIAQDDCTIGSCPGKAFRYIGDEGYVDSCLWYDVVPGMMYSVSTAAPDLDGFDIIAIADMLYVPLQGDVG